MKDLKVYDGAGWQSLKGPPGPSTPSADAGNDLSLGSDGLLFLRDAAVSEGVFAPTFLLSVNTSGDDGDYVGRIVSVDPGDQIFECYWSRAGRLVTVTVRFGLQSDGGVYVDRALIGGLPFAIADRYPSENSQGDSPLSPPCYYAPIFTASAAVAVIKPAGVAFCQFYPSATYDQTVGQVIEVMPEAGIETGVGGWFSLTYETDDPPVSRGT